MELGGTLRLQRLGKANPGDWREQPEKWKESQETVLSEEGISGRKVVLNVADLRICCWINC